jgi:hypothetical protein
MSRQPKPMTKSQRRRVKALLRLYWDLHDSRIAMRADHLLVARAFGVKVPTARRWIGEVEPYL